MRHLSIFIAILGLCWPSEQANWQQDDGASMEEIAEHLGLPSNIFPPIPCPHLFRYAYNSSRRWFYGLLEIPNDPRANVFNVEVNMSVNAQIPPNGGLKMVVLSQHQDIVQKRPLRYGVTLPEASSPPAIPQLTQVKVNGEIICSGLPPTVIPNVVQSSMWTQSIIETSAGPTTKGGVHIVTYPTTPYTQYPTYPTYPTESTWPTYITYPPTTTRPPYPTYPTKTTWPPYMTYPPTTTRPPYTTYPTANTWPTYLTYPPTNTRPPYPTYPTKTTWPPYMTYPPTTTRPPYPTYPTTSTWPPYMTYPPTTTRPPYTTYPTTITWPTYLTYPPTNTRPPYPTYPTKTTWPPYMTYPPTTTRPPYTIYPTADTWPSYITYPPTNARPPSTIYPTADTWPAYITFPPRAFTGYSARANLPSHLGNVPYSLLDSKKYAGLVQPPYLSEDEKNRGVRYSQYKNTAPLNDLYDVEDYAMVS